jgi:hypothetical protein
MIKHDRSYVQPDWYSVSPSDLDEITITECDGLKLYAPGVLNTKNVLRVHRSMLPLFTKSPEAIAIIGQQPRYDWQARDQGLAERKVQLRVTQQQALDYIEPRRGVLVGDDMRLGKTLTALMAHDPTRGPLVIVAPLSARGVWLTWIKRLWPDTPIGVALGKKLDKETIQKPIVFVHYEIVRQWQSVFKIGTLVLDEAHFLINGGSKRSLAVVLLASRAAKVIALTGTPIWKKPKDLWNIVGTLAPGAWGSFHEFCYRYGAPEETAYGRVYNGLSNELELKARLSEVMIRRLWKDCANDLPAISRNVIIADVDQATRRRLDVIAASLRTERTNAAANLARYREQIAKFKLKAALAEAKRIYESGEPQVVFTWHKSMAKDVMIDLVADGIYDAVCIHGDIAQTLRDDIIDKWRKMPRGILIATMAVAQVAIDLSHAHLTTFVELDWTPGIIAQAEMRTFDVKRPMAVTFIVADHVVDQRIVKALTNKLASSEALGLGAAVDAIQSIRDALEGPGDSPDMCRFLDDLLQSGDLG